MIIYALVDANTLEVRYVGKTFRPSARWANHKLPRSGTYKERWFRSAYPNISMLVLERVEGNGGNAEKLWIEFFRALGARLTNLTDGGEGVVGLKHSESSRLKMSASHTGVKLSPVHAAATTAAKLGRPVSALCRFSISLSNTGGTEETRKKLSLAQPLGPSGTHGVSWDGNRRKWMARVGFKGKDIHLGRYVNKADAETMCLNFRMENGW